MLIQPADVSITDSIQVLSDVFFTWLPRLVAAFVILLVAYVIARVLRTVIRKVMGRLDVDGRVRGLTSRTPTGIDDVLGRISLTAILATVVFWVVLVVGFSLALTTLDIPGLEDALATVWSYVPNIIGALVILLVALLIAGGIAAGVTKLMGDTVLGKLVATVVPVVIVVIAVFMALVQLQLGVQIVTATYYIVLGGIALGAALAFGLGGRDAAKAMLDAAYASGQSAAPQAREEAKLARERAISQAAAARERAEARRREGGNTVPD